MICEPICEKLIKVIDPGSPKISNENKQKSQEAGDTKPVDDRSIPSDK